MAEQKELVIVPIKSQLGFKIKYAGGGELPKDLEGMYTSQYFAQKSIDKYLTKKKRKSNGTSTSK